MKGFTETDPAKLNENAIELISAQWMLVTAGDAQSCNTMTASWGGLGEMWGEHMALVVVRPQRFTKGFIDQNDRFTLSFLPEGYRKALAYCGSHSGRDEDKIANAGLTSGLTPGGTPYIEEARLVLECRKMYVGEFSEEKFIDKGIVEKWYPARDFHQVYFCAIDKAFEKTGR